MSATNEEPMANVVFKLMDQDQNDVRRISMQSILEQEHMESAAEFEFIRFVRFCTRSFPQFQGHFALYYLDDENELIKVSNEPEFMEAIALWSELNAQMQMESNVVQFILKPDEKNPLEYLEQVKNQEKVEKFIVDVSKFLQSDTVSNYMKQQLIAIIRDPFFPDALVAILKIPKYAKKIYTFSDLISQGKPVGEAAQEVFVGEQLVAIFKILKEKCKGAASNIDNVQAEIENMEISLKDGSKLNVAEAVQEDVGTLAPPSALFEEDLTFPDGSIVSPSQQFTKSWKIKNNGESKWPSHVRLQFVGGDQMNAENYIDVPQIDAGDSIELSVPMTAPVASGRYTGYWRLISTDGHRFGQRLWVDVNVVEDSLVQRNDIVTPIHVESKESNEDSEESDASSTTESTPVETFDNTATEVEAEAEAPAQSENSPVPPPAPTTTESSTPSNEAAASEVAPSSNDEVNSPSEGSAKWEDELKALAEMGFTDREVNVGLLNDTNGNVSAVISALLG